jgi:hypothetical protein
MECHTIVSSEDTVRLEKDTVRHLRVGLPQALRGIRARQWILTVQLHSKNRSVEHSLKFSLKLQPPLEASFKFATASL